MSLKTVLSLLAAFQAVKADFSHPLHFKKVDAVAAKGIAAAKGSRVAAASGNLVNDQGFWFSNFTIGGSPNLEILIDTGSSDAILNPGIYKPGPNSVNTNTPFSISYATTNPDGSGTLSASGKVYQDVITQHDANLTVPQQYLGVVTSPKSPPTFPHDGLIGYAGIDSSALNETPFFQSLCDQGSLSSCRFGLALNADETGTLYYGTVATDQFSGDLVSVSASDEWIVTGDVTLNGKTVRSSVSIITDSGTTVIFGPTSQVKTLFQQAGIQAVSTSNGITGYYACDAPPTIGLAFDGNNFNILPEALAFSQSGNNCTASIHGTTAFGSQWLVGQAFFQGKYIDHNVDDSTMGFATLVSCVQKLFIGQENTPENHLFALVRSVGFYSPRHKHNFDQFRYAYKGDISISPDKNAVEGELVYHPEGVYYGPQKDSEGERVALILQFCGTSGQGFLSYRQLEEGQKELAQLGHFEGGKYYRNGSQKGDEPQDGYEALWEKFNGRHLVYPPGRYKDPIFMSPINYAWRPADNVANTEGMAFKKSLGVFTERETRAEMIKLKKLGKYSINSENAIRLVFVVSGAGEVEGQPWEEESAIRILPEKGIVLSANQDAELLLFTLPLLN